MTPPSPPEAGYHLSADLADRAREFVADLRAVDVDRPFFLYLCRGPATHPTTPRPSGSGATGGASTGAGMPGGRRPSSGRRRSASSSRAPSSRAAGLGPGVGQPRSSRPGGGRPVHGVLRRLPVLHRPPAGPGAGLPRDGDLERTASWWSRTTGPAPRAARRVDQRHPADERRPGRARGAAGPHRRARWTERPQQLPVGLDHGRQHAVPALEARGPRRRGGQPVHRVVALGPGPGTGGLRHQFTHAIDLVPTLLDLVGLEAPTSWPTWPRRRSKARASPARWSPRATPSPRRHHTQYFEMLGCRAVYHRGWKAVTYKPIGPLYDDGLDPDAPFAEDVWELYHVAVDPDRDAGPGGRRARAPGRDDRLPVDRGPSPPGAAPRQPGAAHLLNPRPSGRPPRTRFVYYPGTAPVPEPLAVDVKNRGHRSRSTSPCPRTGRQVLLALGTVLGGWSLHVVEGRLRYGTTSTARSATW